MLHADSPADIDKHEALTVRDVLATSSFAGTQVLAGASGLDRTLSSINVMENPTILPWVKSHELLITVGYALVEEQQDLATLIEALAALDLAGFGLKLGPFIDEVGEAALAAADRLGFPILSLPTAVSFDDLIADIYRARDSLLLGGRHRKSDREQRLMKVALDGGGPADVAEHLAVLANCEVLVLGPDNDVMAHHAAQGVPLSSEDAAVTTSRLEEAVTAPIVFGSTYVGRLYVFPTLERPEDFFPGLVPTCAQIMALSASREIAAASVDRQFRSEFLERVLRNRLDDREVSRRCQALDWVIEYPAAIVSLSPEILDATPYVERVRDALGWALRARNLKAPHAIINGDVVAIVGSSPSDPDPVAAAVDAANEVIARSAPGAWSAGVSAQALIPEGLERAWSQAQIATKVNRIVGGQGTVGKFADLGIYRLLAEVDPALLQDFAKEALGELYEPSGDKAELRRTLSVLLDSNLNVASTARTLYYHYNTIRSRVTKLETMLGPFLTDPNRRLELHVALLIANMASEADTLLAPPTQGIV